MVYYIVKNSINLHKYSSVQTPLTVVINTPITSNPNIIIKSDIKKYKEKYLKKLLLLKSANQ